MTRTLALLLLLGCTDPQPATTAHECQTRDRTCAPDDPRVCSVWCNRSTVYAPDVATAETLACNGRTGCTARCGDDDAGDVLAP